MRKRMMVSELADFDVKKYINGISGQVQISGDSPMLDFDLLLLRDGSGIVVQLKVPKTGAKSIPVLITTQQLIGIAAQTLDLKVK